MPENINWSGVIQSITDTWLPLIGFVAVIIVIVVLVKVFKNRKNK